MSLALIPIGKMNRAQLQLLKLAHEGRSVEVYTRKSQHLAHEGRITQVYTRKSQQFLC